MPSGVDSIEPWRQNLSVIELVFLVVRGIVVACRGHYAILRAYLAYYHRSRTHLALAKDAPDGRACASGGRIVVTPEVGGLHHGYDRQAA